MKKQPKNNNNQFLTETWISLVWQNPLSHEQVMAVVPKLFYMAAQFQGCKNFAAPLLQSRRHLGGGLAPPNKVPNPPNRNMKHYKPLGVCQTCKRPAEQRLHWERKEKRIPGQSLTSSIVKCAPSFSLRRSHKERGERRMLFAVGKFKRGNNTLRKKFIFRAISKHILLSAGPSLARAGTDLKHSCGARLSDVCRSFWGGN